MSKQQKPPTQFIVTQRIDGRGGIKPFGTFKGGQQGAGVMIGDKTYKVTSDGRVNIPKSIMDKFGVEGSDGRKRVTIHFSAGKGKEGWKDVSAAIKKPVDDDRDKRTGAVVTKHRVGVDRNVLKPKDSPDRTWSPQ